MRIWVHHDGTDRHKQVEQGIAVMLACNACQYMQKVPAFPLGLEAAASRLLPFMAASFSWLSVFRLGGHALSQQINRSSRQAAYMRHGA